MKFRITYVSIIFMIIAAAVLIAAACATPAPAVKTPATSAPPAVARPQIRDIAGPLEWHPNEQNVLICACSDPDGNPLTYFWTADKGTIKGEGQRVYWVPPDELGEYQITVKVANDKGEEAIFSKKFTVVAPPPPPEDRTVYLKLTPPASSVSRATGRVRSFFVSEIQCQVPDRDPAEFTYIWTANGGKLMADGLDDGKASRVGWLAPGAGGQFIVKVTVADKAGNKAEGEVTYEVLCCRDP
jgi:hypothetical protein